MLNVTFNTTTQRLDVVDESVKLGAGVYAGLAIDTLSTGGPNTAATAYGSFDPAQPWTVLNGAAFSRRLGWYDPNSAKTDGTSVQSLIEAAYTAPGVTPSIWIELQSESAGLETFKAVGKWGVNSAGTLDANSVPIIDPNAGGYSPIFGTNGSSTMWQWDYMMDHNVYAVPSAYLTTPNQLFTATYKVYVGDSQGNEILNQDGSSASSIETWTWQGPANCPEPATMGLLLAGSAAMLRRRK